MSRVDIELPESPRDAGATTSGSSRPTRPPQDSTQRRLQHLSHARVAPPWA